MKIVVPMAGMGKRMRPHTLTVPKPLIPIAGKPIVQRLVEDIAEISHEQITDIGFIVGEFGKEVEDNLLEIAKSLGAKGHIFYQLEALGTAHAILCAEPLLDGQVTVAFADTLFRADFSLDNTNDGVLWVQRIENPEQFGVVVVDENDVIKEFVEKPQTFVSDMAMIGIYYFKDGAILRDELQYLIDNKVIKSGEYQLPDALRNMTQKGMKFTPAAVNDWLDCGNKDATVRTNNRILEYNKDKNWVSESAKVENSTIIQPCFIGENVSLRNCVIGPHVSIGDGSVIESSVISDSIVQGNTTIAHCSITNSMIGNHVRYINTPEDLSLGDYSTHGK